MKTTLVGGVLASCIFIGAEGPGLAQVTPAPAIDAPTAPLAGPPLNQPPRQLAPESDAVTDPAMAATHQPPATLGLDKGQKRCMRLHRGYDPATRSYTDAEGRQRPCG